MPKFEKDIPPEKEEELPVVESTNHPEEGTAAKEMVEKETEMAVDPNQIFYHGTDKNFAEFSDDYSAYGKGNLGTFFTKNPDLASDFTREDWEKKDSEFRVGANVRPVYLSVKNPKILTPEEFIRIGNYPEYKKTLIEGGYDGVIVKPFDEASRAEWIKKHGETKGMKEFETPQYAVFSAKQIKSIFDRSQ